MQQVYLIHDRTQLALAQDEVLTFLTEHYPNEFGPMRIADELKLARSTVHQQLKALLKKKLISKTTDGEYRAKTPAEVTSQAQSSVTERASAIIQFLVPLSVYLKTSVALVDAATSNGGEVLGGCDLLAAKSTLHVANLEEYLASKYRELTGTDLDLQYRTRVGSKAENDFLADTLKLRPRLLSSFWVLIFYVTNRRRHLRDLDDEYRILLSTFRRDSEASDYLSSRWDQIDRDLSNIWRELRNQVRRLTNDPHFAGHKAELEKLASKLSEEPG